MRLIDLPSCTDVDASSLSERARALLLAGGGPGAPAHEAPACGQAHILLWTLLVLRASRLRRFADHVGMLAAGAALRQVLEGRRIAAFREQLGHELFQFGMLRAPLIGTLSVAPANFDDPGRVGVAVREAGVAALQAFCHGLDGEHRHLRARLCALLREIAPIDPAQVLATAPSGALLHRVLREVEPVLVSALDGAGALP